MPPLRPAMLTAPSRSVSRPPSVVPMHPNASDDMNASAFTGAAAAHTATKDNDDWEHKYNVMRDKCEVLGRRLLESISAAQQREIDLTRHLNDEQASHNAEVIAGMRKIESALLECIPDDFAALVAQPSAAAVDVTSHSSSSEVLSKMYRTITLSQTVAAQRKLDAASTDATSKTWRDALLPVKQQVSDAARVLFHLTQKQQQYHQQQQGALEGKALQSQRPSSHNHGVASSSRASPQPLFPPPSPTARRPVGGAAVLTSSSAQRRSGSTDSSAIRYVPLDGTPEVQRVSVAALHVAGGGASSDSRRQRSASATTQKVDVKGGSLLRELDGTPHDDGPFAKLRERLGIRPDVIPTLPGKTVHVVSSKKSASPKPRDGSEVHRTSASASQAPSGSFEVRYFSHKNAPTTSTSQPDTRPSSIAAGTDHDQQGGIHSCDPSPQKHAPTQSTRNMNMTTATMFSDMQAVCDLLREAFHALDRLTTTPQEGEASAKKHCGSMDVMPHWIQELQADIRRLTTTSLEQLQRFSVMMQPTTEGHKEQQHFTAKDPRHISLLVERKKNNIHQVGDGNESVATNLFSSSHRSGGGGGDVIRTQKQHHHYNTTASSLMPSRNVSLESQCLLDIEEFSDNEMDDVRARPAATTTFQHPGRDEEEDDKIELYPRPEPLRSTQRFMSAAAAAVAAGTRSTGKRVIGFIPAPSHADHDTVGHDDEEDRAGHYDQPQPQQRRRIVVSPMFDE
ncbi:Hypothetical protein, putative [Bodo saltans]|uniref:Uncharacterized protein n=1 Tax=Bodo saltans TaxID=75058 RepID=A0A0S4J8V5_BODSA|nr:Hypothetical protein, putative [Bodo saltans]|eukprot:CUG86632.1 Hypothetical protein, putative [Bodo saltans]